MFEQPEKFQHRIFELTNESAFNTIALEIFKFQHENNFVYRSYVQLLKKNINTITHYTQIPFLPIELFKTQEVISFQKQKSTLFFQSSGTGNTGLSTHYIKDVHLYHTSLLKSFELFYGNPKDYLFVFLLPEDSERPYSSLISMAQYLLSLSSEKESRFYLHKMNDAQTLINKYKGTEKKIFILGITYAIMDFAETNIELNNNTILMETGGMKGKRQELSKQELHQYLTTKFKIQNIHSEYGMTELLSQAYSKKDGIFNTPPWMKILIRDVDDPLAIHVKNKQGLINIIDLANIYTCSFIATQDVGKLYNNGSFEILGRSDFSDTRGCNLMYQ